jgi:O-antigen ligase
MFNVAFEEKYGRATGAFGQPNTYACFAVMFLPFCISFLTNTKSFISKIFLILTIFCGVYCLLLTGSRGGMVAFVVGSFVLYFITAKRIDLMLFLKSFISIIFIVILLSIAYAMLPESSKQGIELNLIGRAGSESLSEYSSGRLEIWAAGLLLFIRNPLFGSGWGTFAEKVGVSSHNDFLNCLTTLGIIGFVLFLLILYRIFRSALYYRQYSTENIWFLNGYIASFFSFMTAMFFVNLYTSYYFFAVFSALILKIGYIDSRLFAEKSQHSI